MFGNDYNICTSIDETDSRIFKVDVNLISGAFP